MKEIICDRCKKVPENEFLKHKIESSTWNKKGILLKPIVKKSILCEECLDEIHKLEELEKNSKLKCYKCDAKLVNRYNEIKNKDIEVVKSRTRWSSSRYSDTTNYNLCNHCSNEFVLFLNNCKDYEEYKEKMKNIKVQDTRTDEEVEKDVKGINKWLDKHVKLPKKSKTKRGKK